MSLATAERAAISDTFDAVGPDRPTLCDGWTTADLLAHVLVRERQPWAAGGIVVPALAPLTDKAMESWASTPWTERVEALRSGPPAWSPLRLPGVDALVNGAELFVHHEDARRGEPGWEPRPADPVRDGELRAVLRRTARMLYRKSPVGVVLALPDGERIAAKNAGPGVTVTGEPAELVLHGFGRSAVRVEVDGAAADVAALASSSRGV
jgi:uncharacterized protein (TIGR03085 family)